MGVVQRREFLFSLALCGLPAFGADPAPASVRGKLVDGPAIVTKEGKRIELTGDEATMGVLRDQRVLGVADDFEADGHFTGANKFAINPIHTRSLFTYHNGKKQMITYWCDVCYIRTYTPGKCWCCQEQTKLDLIDPDKVDKK